MAHEEDRIYYYVVYVALTRRDQASVTYSKDTICGIQGHVIAFHNFYSVSTHKSFLPLGMFLTY